MEYCFGRHGKDDNASCNRSGKTMATLYKLYFELFSYAPYSPDLASSNFYLLANHKKIPTGKKMGSFENVITERKTYFIVKCESF